MRLFTREILLNASVQAVWDFHMQPDALQLLSPPQSDVTILESNPVEQGRQVVFSVRVAPLPVKIRWVAEYARVEPPTRFVDVARRSPFAAWEHHHLFLDREGHCLLRDEVHYQARLGALGDAVTAPFVRRQLNAVFDHRHRVLGVRFGTWDKT